MWAAVYAVTAGSAGDGSLGVDDVHHLVQQGALIGGEGLEIAHKAEVVLQLFRGRHAAEDHAHVIQRGGKADGPGGGGGAGIGGLEESFSLRGKRGEQPALYRLHDHYRLTVLAADLIARLGLDLWIVPI